MEKEQCCVVLLYCVVLLCVLFVPTLSFEPIIIPVICVRIISLPFLESRIARVRIMEYLATRALEISVHIVLLFDLGNRAAIMVTRALDDFSGMVRLGNKQTIINQSAVNQSAVNQSIDPNLKPQAINQPTLSLA